MRDNTCNYSDEYQPYTGDYDKFEYDVKLKDGTVLTNCYPNAGKFNVLDSDVSCEETDVEEIRFSNEPMSTLNIEVSRFIPKYEPVETIPFTMIPSHYNYGEKASQYRREFPKVGRNELCFCGSGKKSKKCCNLK